MALMVANWFSIAVLCIPCLQSHHFKIDVRPLVAIKGEPVLMRSTLKFRGEGCEFDSPSENSFSHLNVYSNSSAKDQFGGPVALDGIEAGNLQASAKPAPKLSIADGFVLVEFVRLSSLAESIDTSKGLRVERQVVFSSTKPGRPQFLNRTAKIFDDVSFELSDATPRNLAAARKAVEHQLTDPALRANAVHKLVSWVCFCRRTELASLHIILCDHPLLSFQDRFIPSTIRALASDGNPINEILLDYLTSPVFLGTASFDSWASGLIPKPEASQLKQLKSSPRLFVRALAFATFSSDFSSGEEQEILANIRRWTSGDPSPEVTKLVRQLDSSRFAERESASNRLLELAAFHEPFLHAEMRNTSSAEIQLRLGHILHDFPSAKSMSSTMVSRMIATCERLNTKNSRQILDILASGHDDCHFTKLARDATMRLKPKSRQ